MHRIVFTAGIIAALTIGGCTIADRSSKSSSSLKASVQFKEVTRAVGLTTSPSWKYGGPTVADLNNDGRYELLLGNHDQTPAHLFWAQSDNTYIEHENAIARWDLHGMAAGDYDLDGDLDVVYLLGGGNGTQPQPPRLLRNDNGTFVDVTIEAGLSGLGARGRSPRWIDMNSDGYLDLLLVNARQVVGESGPRHIVFQNLGNGRFTHRPIAALEQIEAERVLVTDFNGDSVPDLVMFSPLTLLRGDNQFGFMDVTRERLAGFENSIDQINAVAEADIDNDGDLDLYLARGKTHYQTANNAVSFDRSTGRLDLRDEGNRGHDGISFKGNDRLWLSDFWHWHRGVDLELPLFVGQQKQRFATPTEGISISATEAKGFPEEITENGWYLGYVGRKSWRLEWRLNGDLAWGLRASVTGVKSIHPDWTPQQLGVADILLRNDDGRFTDISDRLPPSAGDNNWGVTNGDFDNDGLVDFFVYRFGELVWRQADVLMLNSNNGTFTAQWHHGANALPGKSHGDMGAAFDYNLDGQLDLLSGDDDDGIWRLYQNQQQNQQHHWLLLHVRYSEGGVDPLGAEIELETDSGQQYKRVGSSGAVHSQSAMNIAHFGLGLDERVKHIRVRWRDGSVQEILDVPANQKLVVGR